MNVHFGDDGAIARNQSDKDAKSRRFPTKTFVLLFGLGALAVLNTNFLQSSHVRKLAETIFDHPDWDQYWEDLFAPKVVYVGIGERSVPQLQPFNIGYFLTLTSCPGDAYSGGDPNDPGTKHNVLGERK